MKTVHVVCKTHLDLGFTDLAANIERQYFEEFIPGAIALAERVNAQSPLQPLFVWTTGSWLIYHFLERANPGQRVLMEKAIAAGYIKWHALPFTTHTELMDKDLLAYGLSLSKTLDERFGKKTIAAKMTDVPGHTMAMIDGLADSGVRYLHLGVNPASAVPDVPVAFVWRSKSGKEIIVNYAEDYGAVYENEHMDDVLCFLHTYDNRGPSDEKALHKKFAQLQQVYPTHTIKASTLDAFAESIWAVKDRLPVLTSEIGDTWIHGSGSDPYKMNRFRELLALKNNWLAQGLMHKEESQYKGFCDALLKITEHTWGLDEKTYLPDFRHYVKKDFVKAKKQDKVRLLANPPSHYKDCVFAFNTKHPFHTRTYRFFESSWVEQRAYLTEAVNSLSTPLREEAVTALAAMTPQKITDFAGYGPVKIGIPLSLGRFQITFGEAGITSIVPENGPELVGFGAFGQVDYQLFNQKDYDFFLHNYIRNFKETSFWSIPDFGKPGLERVQDRIRDGRYTYKMTEIFVAYAAESDIVVCQLAAEPFLSEEYGAPRLLQIKYTFAKQNPSFSVEVCWFDKDSSRLPEAVWVRFPLTMVDVKGWQMQKVGCSLPIDDIVPKGNRNLSCVEGLIYEDETCRLTLENKHAHLFSPGKGKILQFDNAVPTIAEGLSFNLYNNLWGTNFPMWHEDDERFVFRFTFEKKSDSL